MLMFDDLISAIKTSNINVIEQTLKRGESSSNMIMTGAARHGRIDIVELMLKKGANNYDLTMAYAAKGGYTDIVKLMLERGASDYDWAMVCAAEGNHIEILERLLVLSEEERSKTRHNINDVDWHSGSIGYYCNVLNAARATGYIDVSALIYAIVEGKVKIP